MSEPSILPATSWIRVPSSTMLFSISALRTTQSK